MSKRLFLLCGLSGALLIGCANQAKKARYAHTSCDTLRTLQAAYDSEVALGVKPQQLAGVNAIDRRRRQENVLGTPRKDYRGFSQSARNDLDAIRAAYRKNNCDNPT